MKSIKGITFIFASIAITLYAWISAGATRNITAGLALTTLSLTFMLATRVKLLEKWFNGIEKMYFYHKLMAVFSVILLVMHHKSKGFGLWSERIPARLGDIAIYLFISVVIVAYISKKLKYETWRWIHRIVFIAYIIGLWHGFTYSRKAFTSVNLLSLVIGVYAVLGLVSGIYIIFLYQKIGFKNNGKIVSVKRLNHDTTELEIELDKNFDYRYGQFAFIKIFQEGFEKAPHPFSISGGKGNKIFFTIKNSGDYTSDIYQNLKEGTKVKIDRAYGHMLLEKGKEKQIWIAGGIGVTPFISYIRENEKIDGNIDFYYAYRGEENAVHIDMMKQFAQKNPNFKLNLVDSKVSGYLNFDNYKLENGTTVFMCGPVKMMDNFANVFNKLNSTVELVYEGFKFK
ncbi:ferric reductase-like transmembrane domain-containing protein [Leptotrichia sp. HSP-342]|uniref:Ferric reductase-like transmembrane domain-containing protein n=1 Tax=Leptotrichia mesophila TaxID=3239303 RepID=A0AB39V9R6_9FUSO